VEDPRRIVRQDELHEPRAEPADAIEQEQVAAFGVW
jgi:hypothetical protein